jgi:hypothetical protein
MPVECKCEVCGGLFTVPPSVKATGRGRCCSPSCSGMRRRTPIVARLAAMTQKESGDGCWIFTGMADDDGYGQIEDADLGKRPAHIVAWELTRGLVPKGWDVHHTCRNTRCVNPAHLELLSHLAHLSGEFSSQAKLTALQVQTIRERFALGGETRVELAKEFGVCRWTIGNIIRGHNWKEVGDYAQAALG